MADRIMFTILEDGEIKIETEGISGANHASADQLLAEVEKLAGGKVETVRKRPGHVHIVSGQQVYHKH